MWIYPLGMRVILAGGLLAIAALSGAAAGPLQDGRAAFKRRDFAEAMRLWRPLAEQGDDDAQVDLASLYLNGNGVPQDYAQALIWERKAADRGNVVAQAVLGAMFEFGRGVPQDNVQAHMWFDLAASRPADSSIHDLARQYRDELSTKMTPAQIAEAQKMAREWAPKQGSGRSDRIWHWRRSGESSILNHRAESESIRHAP
jgi:TPR repeat protein